MIKLFWNTHHQQKPNSNDKKTKEKQESDYGWGGYHKKSSESMQKENPEILIGRLFPKKSTFSRNLHFPLVPVDFH